MTYDKSYDGINVSLCIRSRNNPNKKGTCLIRTTNAVRHQLRISWNHFFYIAFFFVLRFLFKSVCLFAYLVAQHRHVCWVFFLSRFKFIRFRGEFSVSSPSFPLQMHFFKMIMLCEMFYIRVLYVFVAKLSNEIYFSLPSRI